MVSPACRCLLAVGDTGPERARTAGLHPAGGPPLETGALGRDRCRGWPMIRDSVAFGTTAWQAEASKAERAQSTLGLFI